MLQQKKLYQLASLLAVGYCIALVRLILILLAGQLTGIPHSGRNTELWQNISLQQIPENDEGQYGQNLFHFFPFQCIRT
jgi:hypothetical protein